MVTFAPPLVLELLKSIFAKFFSNKVFPINIPSPKPVADFLSISFDLRYGSPIFDITFLEYPEPSSSINISVISSLLLRFIFTFLFENLLAFPIKFLKP